jgi:hypothetical protein
MFRYTLLRTLIFLGCLLLLWLLGLRDRDEMVMLVVGSALISMVISWFGLRRMREEYSAQLAARLERRANRRRGVSDEAAEDAEVGLAPGDDSEPETYR